MRCLYENSSSRVKIGNQLGELLSVYTGVLQGKTLAPFLFMIVLDHALRWIPQQYGFVQNCTRRLDFADEIAPLTGSVDRAQEHLVCLAEQAYEVATSL
jgi:hypothetical protein